MSRSKIKHAKHAIVVPKQRPIATGSISLSLATVLAVSPVCTAFAVEASPSADVSSSNQVSIKDGSAIRSAADIIKRSLVGQSNVSELKKIVDQAADLCDEALKLVNEIEAPVAELDAAIAEAASAEESAKANLAKAQTAYDEAYAAAQGKLSEAREAMVRRAQAARSELDAAIDALAAAKAEHSEKSALLDEARANAEGAKQVYDKLVEESGAAAAELVLAEAEYMKAKKTYDDAVTQKKEASALLKQAEDAEKKAKLAYEESVRESVTLESAKKKSDESLAFAKAELQEAEAALAGIEEKLDVDAVAGADAAIAAAESKVASAQNDLDAAEAAIEAANSELSVSEAHIAAALQTKQNAQDAYDVAIAANGILSSEVQALESSYGDAKSNLEAKNTDAVAAARTLRDAEEALNKAIASARNARSQAIDAKTAMEAKQKEVDELAASAPSEVYSNSAAGFFEHMVKQTADASKKAEWEMALSILKMPDDPSHALFRNEAGISEIGWATNIGDKKDATNLDNVIRSLDYIDQANDLRKNSERSFKSCDCGFVDESCEIAGGLETPLKTNPVIMAIAMVQTNASAALTEQNTLGHTRRYNVGENLAWGCADPFSGWYDREKQVYEWIKEGITQDDAIANGDGGYNWQTGHYANLLNVDYATTGFAISYYGNYRITHGQTFSSGYHHATDMSVSAFRSLLEEYQAHLEEHGDLEVAQLELAELTAVYEAKDVEAVKAEEKIVGLETKRSDALAVKEAADIEVANAQETHDTAKASYEAEKAKLDADVTMKSASIALVEAEKEVEAAQARHDSLSASIPTSPLSVALSQKKLAQSRKDSAQVELDEAIAAKENLANGLAEAKTTVEAKRDALTSAMDTANSNATAIAAHEARMDALMSDHEDKLYAVEKRKADLDAIVVPSASIHENLKIEWDALIEANPDLIAAAEAYGAAQASVIEAERALADAAYDEGDFNIDSLSMAFEIADGEKAALENIDLDSAIENGGISPVIRETAYATFLAEKGLGVWKSEVDDRISVVVATKAELDVTQAALVEATHAKEAAQRLAEEKRSEIRANDEYVTALANYNLALATYDEARAAYDAAAAVQADPFEENDSNGGDDRTGNELVSDSQQDPTAGFGTNGTEGDSVQRNEPEHVLVQTSAPTSSTAVFSDHALTEQTGSAVLNKTGDDASVAAGMVGVVVLSAAAALGVGRHARHGRHAKCGKHARL